MMGWLDRLGWFGKAKPATISDALWQQTLDDLPFLAALSPAEQERLRDLTQQFLAEKEFTPAGGLELTDALCVAIAAQGCLPILELGLSAYRDWVGLIVYPDEFVAPRRFEDENGVVHEYDDVISGEAWPGGPLIISWKDVQLAGDPAMGGYNVVIHEFAHKLDMLNGEADGLPALHSGLTAAEWESTLLVAYDHFCQRVDSGEDTDLDPYASEHPAEFFAVTSEIFFTWPDLLAGEYPELYDLYRRYYRQDPRRRFA